MFVPAQEAQQAAAKSRLPGAAEAQGRVLLRELWDMPGAAEEQGRVLLREELWDTQTWLSAHLKAIHPNLNPFHS